MPVERLSPLLPSLLRNRLIIVTGKGGTGKTTVAAALGVAAARRGVSALVAEVGGLEQIPQRVSPGHLPVGYEPQELIPGLHSIHIDPFAALAEYLGLQTHLPGVVDLVMRNKGFAQLLGAAPGWRELITLGKVWHLAQMQEARGPRYQLIIIDAPATGHGLTFLDVPRVVGTAVRAGPLRKNAHLVEELIRDPDQTLLLPVALPEELPARETAELVRRARDEIGVAVDRVVVNAVPPHPFPPPAPSDLDERLQRIPEEADLGRLPPARVMAGCATHLRERYEVGAVYTQQIAESCGEPLVILPYRPGELAGADALASLAEPLLAGAEA